MDEPCAAATSALRREEPLDELLDAPLDHEHLHQIDAARRATRERAHGAPAAREGRTIEAHAGPEARADAPRLDLDGDERASLLEQEIELRPARAQSTGDEAPAACAQRALRQSLAREREQGIARVERADGAAGSEARDERAQERS
jgi:hypothetical protein